ncbi:MAG: 16S rRNA (adenine(1518)-N(6)/adenine(1519)-N(6))-dimethyltransferase RsmA [Clostridia bacterium]|nr:16S rRNA (adenine(1518)-N(6)/adenine(1519)-N(6))-dimethyltransferase RsmA [Clostridia bacterium]
MSKHNLTDIKEIRAVMGMFGKHFSKSLGQNFLINSGVIEDTVSGSGVSKDTNVLEIGPGIGTLTMALAKRANKVVAVEIDTKLLPVLDYTLEDYDNVSIIHGDILKLDINELYNEHFKSGKAKVVANLPYYITTPIIMKLLEHRELFESITVMVQKEVAYRLAADEGSKDYSAVSIAVGYYAEPEIIVNVRPDDFCPPPKVHSAVIKLNIRENPPFTPEDEKFFFKLVKAGFAQRRKTFINSVSSSGISKADAAAALSEIGLDENIRAEKISPAQFCALSDILYKKSK